MQSIEDIFDTNAAFYRLHILIILPLLFMTSCQDGRWRLFGLSAEEEERMRLSLCLADSLMEEETVSLKEVTVKANKVRENGDTITYNVATFADRNDRSIGDLIRATSINVIRGRELFVSLYYKL